MISARIRNDRPAINRRNFLYVATAATGVAGLVAATWPFIDQMNPDAGARAVRGVIDLALSEFRPAQFQVVKWQNMPIFVVRRTAEMLDAMREKSFVSRLIDPQSQRRQQPAYAKNWHRSIDPAYAVLVGICTHCACVPRYLAEAFAPEPAGGYMCPCCASRYDPAGRTYAGPAQYNLPVPPHEIVGGARILIGKNMPGELFSLKSIERL